MKEGREREREGTEEVDGELGAKGKEIGNG